MVFSKTSDPPSSPPPQLPESYYNPLPSEPHHQQRPQYVIVLPRYYNPTSCFRRFNSRRIICVSLLLILTAAAAFFLWPSDPQVSIVRLHLKRFHLRAFPVVTLDIALDVTVRVRNRDFYSIDYKSLFVAVGYRGKQLGYATSQGGHIRARRSSYVNATFELNGVEVLADIIPLLEDVAKGKITFDTETKIGGQLGLLFFEIPLQGQVSCEMIVNIHNQTIEHQNCYPHVLEQQLANGNGGGGIWAWGVCGDAPTKGKNHLLRVCWCLPSICSPFVLSIRFYFLVKSGAVFLN